MLAEVTFNGTDDVRFVKSMDDLSFNWSLFISLVSISS